MSNRQLTLATITGTPTASDLPVRVDSVRRFNRFYTGRIGVLQEGYLHSPFSLAEVRVLYELAHRERVTASDLARDLDFDPGYLSRILRGFLKRGLIDRTRSDRDGRELLLSLNAHGQAAFAPLEARQREEVATLLERLDEASQRRLVDAMSSIETVLGEPRTESLGYVIRDFRPGDMGWVVQRHGDLYWQEYAFDEHFEALVASIVAKFVQHYDPRRERCWIAERDGRNVGCVFLVKGSKTIAKLRLFLVEPDARGLGIGSRLVDECLRFARAAGYRKVRLWTQSILLAARHIYAKAGFQMIEEQPHHSFSRDLVAETWELKL
jgi:DNA-binding MarR family transcriptional regulator/N-acetylglutamate synthase-like GNAT family acetyltransferase